MAKIRVYYASTPKVSMNAVILRSLSISNFDHLNAFQNSSFRSLSNIANLPIIDAIGSELVHHFLFPVVRDADEQATTGLCSIPLHELEVLHFVFHFDQAFVNGQFVDDQLNVGFLSLSQIVCMAKDAEASDISTGTCFIFTKKTCSHKAQSGHLFFSAIESLNKFRLACLFQDFISFFLAGFEPLHGVDGEASSKWFCEDDGIAWLRVVGHDKFLIFDDGNGTAAHHGPLIVDCLSASYLRSCLLRGIGEALDHQGGRHVFLKIIHFGGNSQNHQDFFDVGDAHGVEVGNCVAECDAAEHVGRLHQWVEKVESGDESVRRDFDGRYIWGLNSDWFWQFGQIGEQFVLGHFASSSFHLGEIGQDEVTPEAVLHRVKGRHFRRLAVGRILAERIPEVRDQTSQSLGYSQHSIMQQVETTAFRELANKPEIIKVFNIILDLVLVGSNFG